MLSIEIRPDGGVRIEGDARELTTLAHWLDIAAQEGRAAPSFVADTGLTEIAIERTG